MKANVSRLLIRNEELKGTNEYNKMHMECYAITNGKNILLVGTYQAIHNMMLKAGKIQ